VLLDTSLGVTTPIPNNASADSKKVLQTSISAYDDVLKNSNYFNIISLEQRFMLYEYIKKNIPTWFSSKGGTAKLLFLAGRGVVQLKAKELREAFNIK
jgi:hypothetical protein